MNVALKLLWGFQPSSVALLGSESIQCLLVMHIRALLLAAELRIKTSCKYAAA